MGITKKLGCINIQQEFVYDFVVMSKIFQKFIPLSISYNIEKCMYTYKGYCDEFDETIEGCEIPSYIATANYNRNELNYEEINISISFSKINNGTTI